MRRSLKPPPPARLFFGAFTGFPELFDWVRGRLEAVFGPLSPDEESATFPFPETRTYSRSMGSPLQKRFFFLRAPVPQDCLAGVKLRTIEIEEEASSLREWPVERPINIDPGLLNDCRIILASTKDHAHRIYRGEGIWEEVTLVFREGGYRTLPWTYPDFRNPDYHAYFAAIRQRHLESLSLARLEEDPAAGGITPASEPR